MPIYEYRCKKCGQFEVMRKMSDAPLTRCPTCRNKVTKLISNTSFQLKGSGWYVTDYGRKDGAARESRGESKSESSETSTASAKETKTESKSDTKSEAKSETKATKPASKSKEAAAA